jgi:cytoskeletal protein CcmA (bactofilin family)
MLFNKKPDDASPADRRAPQVRSAEPAAVAPSRVQIGSPTQSVIDAWLTITGNLESQGDVRVEGQIAGDIRCANLVIGRDATVSGDIVAEEAVVRGKVKGTIRANRVILQDSACVESAIYHKVLSVDEGASFDGQSCHRQQPHQEEEATARIMRSTPREVPTIHEVSGFRDQVSGDPSVHP